MNHHPIVVIPAYRPSVRLVELVAGLSKEGLTVVVINDGSPPADEAIFVTVDGLLGVDYLRHPSNLGKGAALKTGFNFVLKHFPDALGVVTVDADGQHLPEDVVKVAEALSNHPQSLVLGVRKFKRGQLPWRSWLGNTLTRKVFGWLTGQQISDTQTGLRGIPTSWLPWLITLSGDRYEYEINMLLETKRLGLSILEEPITTIYEAGNLSSHFNPVVDSLKIYRVLLRYIASSLITAGLDILLFTWLIQLGNSIMVSILISRWVVGAGVNFTLNRSLVFRSGSVIWPVLFRYYLVISVLGLAASWLIGQLIQLTGLPVIYSKIIIEVALFPVGFILQRRWVFTFIASDAE